MGADDASNEPHPAKTNPPVVPCDDEGRFPGPRSGGTDFTHRNHRSDIASNANKPPQQVTGPAGYAVAGKILLAATGALAGVLLALVAMYLYNSARRRRRQSVGGGRRLDRSPAIVLEDRDDGAPSPRGLDPAVLRALPVVVVTARRAGGDCAVCLAELEPGDKARALPRCAHLFHADCIDAWFRGNATCPLCRADVVVPDATAAAEGALPEVRIDVAVAGVEVHGDAARAKASVAPAPAMGRLPSGTDLDNKPTRPASFASARSVSF